MTVHEKLCGILRSDIIKGVGVLIQGEKYVLKFFGNGQKNEH